MNDPTAKDAGRNPGEHTALEEKYANGRNRATGEKAGDNGGREDTDGEKNCRDAADH